MLTKKSTIKRIDKKYDSVTEFFSLFFILNVFNLLFLHKFQISGALTEWGLICWLMVGKNVCPIQPGVRGKFKDTSACYIYVLFCTEVMVL